MAGLSRIDRLTLERDALREELQLRRSELVAAMADAARLRALLREARDAFDEMTGDYPKELVATEEWYLLGAPAGAAPTVVDVIAPADEMTQLRRMATWGLHPSNEPAARKVWAYAADEINRLTAEVERLREAIRWHRLAAEETVGADTTDPEYYEPFDHALWAALGESTPAPIDDRTERWIEKVKADAKPGPKHALSESTPEVPSDG